MRRHSQKIRCSSLTVNSSIGVNLCFDPNTFTVCNKYRRLVHHRPCAKRPDPEFHLRRDQVAYSSTADCLVPPHPKLYLARLLQNQGAGYQAELLGRRAMVGYMNTPNIMHPDILARMSNLVRLLQERGQHNEVERLARRVLEGQ